MLKQYISLTNRSLKLKNIHLESILITLVFTLFLLRKALPEGLASHIGIINIENSSTAKSIREAWGLGDSGSLLEAALTWANFQQLDPTTQYWIVRLWSPGFAILEIPLIWLEKAEIPIFWSLLVVTTCLWVVLIFLLWSKIAPIVGRYIILIILIIFIFSWDFEYFFRNGIFYTEGISIATLILGLFIITWSIIHSQQIKIIYALVGGLLVGISIWIRHVNDNGLFLVLICTSFFYFFVRKSNRFLARKKTGSKLLESRFLLIFALFAFAVTIPWRLLAYFIYGGKPLLMTSAAGLVGPGLWAKPGSGTAQYWGDFGMNWACKIDFQTCQSLPNETNGIVSGSKLILLAVRAAFQNPTEYINERWNSLMLHWIPGFGNLDSLYDLIGITYLPLIIGIFYLFIRINTTKKHLIALIWSPFLLVQIAQLSILHYESRYFITVRFLILGLFVNLLLLRILERNNLLIDNQQLAPFVHKNAICDSNNIGHGTRIWAFSHVLKNAQIGNDCNICENVYIENLAVVGNRVTIKNGVQIWDQVLVEDDVFIGPNVTFTNDKFPRSKQYPDKYLRTVVQKGASIGANATILPGIVIGKGSMVGAGSVVTKDVPNYTLVIGNPARVIRRISNLEE